MQETVDIAQEFYRLNDIEVNPNKTELVIIKPGRKRNIKDLSIRVGNTSTEIMAKNPKETTRFLGVWMSINNQKCLDIIKARSEVGKLTGLLKYK